MGCGKQTSLPRCPQEFFYRYPACPDDHRPLKQASSKSPTG